MPPKPNPPRPGSSPRLSVTEEVAPNAVHEYRPPISNRPPADLGPPPPSFRREPVEDNPSNALPVARPAPRTKTLTAMPAPPSEPPEEGARDSGHIAADGVFRQYEAEHARADALAAELAALRRAPPLPDEVPTRSHWAALLYKLGGALVAILVPCGVYLTYRVETLGPRVDSAQNSVAVARTKADTGRDLQKETLDFLATWQGYQDCINGQQASATVRGTGHKLSTVPLADVIWYEQNKPPNRPAPLWTTWSWTTIKDCGQEPHVPTLPP